MFEVFIREAATRFGLGDKALPLVQMLLAYIADKDTGGLTGFLDKFKAAGLGPIVQSWLGGGPAAQPVGNSQLETVLGASSGLLSLLTSRLALPRDDVTSALGYLLPAIVGKLTPGGNAPSALPTEIASLATIGQGLLSAPAASSGGAAITAGNLLKWLPWVIVVAAALVGLSYCGKERPANTAPPPVQSAPASAAEPASSAPPVPVPADAAAALPPASAASE